MDTNKPKYIPKPSVFKQSHWIHFFIYTQLQDNINSTTHKNTWSIDSRPEAPVGHIQRSQCATVLTFIPLNTAYQAIPDHIFRPTEKAFSIISMIIFTNVENQLITRFSSYEMPTQPERIRLSHTIWKSIHCSDFITQNVHPAQNRTENSVQFFCIIGYLDKK